MRRVKRSNARCIDVYSAPTLDYRHGRLTLGGPLYYAQLALRMAGHKTLVRWALTCPEGDSPYTVFEVEDVEGVKRLKLRAHSKWSCPTPSCAAALFSPVYHDFPAHILEVSKLYKHCILDVQGLVRVADSAGVVERYTGLGSLNAGNCIVKIGADDVTSPGDVEHLIAILNPQKIVFTANGHGFIVVDKLSNTVTHVTIEPVEAEAVGAGDMFNALILSHLLNNTPLEQAAVRAAEEVAEVLARISGLDPRDGIVREVRRLPSAGSYLHEIIKLTANG